MSPFDAYYHSFEKHFSLVGNIYHLLGTLVVCCPTCISLSLYIPASRGTLYMAMIFQGTLLQSCFVILFLFSFASYCFTLDRILESSVRSRSNGIGRRRSSGESLRRQNACERLSSDSVLRLFVSRRSLAKTGLESFLTFQKAAG